MSKKSFKILFAIFIFAVALGVANFSLAATPDVGLQFGASIGLSSADPRIIASRIIQIFLGFLGIIATGLIIYAGFLWMTAAGNEDKIDKAKKTLVSAIIGLIIILSAFAIATFILSKLLAATGGGNVNGDGNGGPAAGIGGAGIIGACSVEGVYPTPNQKDVARNTSIIVSFKEDVDPKTICQTVDSNGFCNGSAIKTSNVWVYKTKDGAANLLADVQVSNKDKKTFIFTPKAYLGSPSEFLWYTIHLSNSIVKSDGRSIFENCQGDYLEWQFEVSNKIDLTPPQILSSGVFPPPDNARDISASTLPVQATGSITVNNSQPKIYAPASVLSVVPLNSSHPASAKVDASYDQGGALVLTVFDKNGSLGATLKKGDVSLGAPSLNGQTISFSGLTLTAQEAIVVGDSWTINVKAVTDADTLTVGSMTYAFVAKDALPNQIILGATSVITAINIKTVLNSNPDVSATVLNNKVTITALKAGGAGNNIVLNSSNGAALDLSGASLSGGVDGNNNVTANPPGQPDQPRNSVIQINFNEPIFPNNVVGDASAVSNVIRVVDIDTGKNLTGKFVMANQYKTLEFISDNECGVNGCGEKIYCLPENSHLRVEVKAASLSAVCSSNNDCSAKSPYNICVGNLCNSVADGNFPQGSATAADGVMDLSLNSLDGNRDNKAQGPASFYNQNSPSVAGDSYSWSFFISDKLDATPPKIEATAPNKDATMAGLTADLEITFNKLMMASSLKTGSTLANNGKIDVAHKNINIWNLADKPIGYWIDSVSILASGVPVKTKALIKHSDFSESMSYRTQVGSGVRDIFQNCFKPSSGPACAGINDTNPSCCNGSAVKDLGSDGNCP